MQTGLILSIVIQLVVLLLLVVWSIVRTVRTKSILRGGLLAYVLLVMWGLLFCVLAPAVVVRVSGDKELAKLFPEPPGLVALVMLGWVHGFILSSVTRGIQIVISKCRAK
jgi:hypothetical protein